MHEQVTIRTADGDCPTHVFTPDGSAGGPWPAVIFFMDGLGIRPVLFAMGQRLADLGYLVLLPDMFYRGGAYDPPDVRAIFATGTFREKLGHLFATIDNARAASDTAAFLAHIDARTDVSGRKVGATGYCMGGAMALAAAGTYPDRIAAAASFHGGNLATDDALSPHRLAPAMRGRIHVAGADADASYPPEMAERLERALADAGVDHHCGIYPGALHGWTMADFPVYDEPAAERHWAELETLFATALK
ncbi:dienelactone hydrolase family protein [Novosphingobium sp. H3SJ31-1]|uniref:Dienelactone hydrolase family protein n=2 Tax=Novosphingobium album (ex Liu et al. 2023) TaxID=3031130 RepID=A0ABT5WMJ4_9SPHN|nr:dienelactone hydrolase family protein [Novosphingobium album (ex Liu et al. 2023)]